MYIIMFLRAPLCMMNQCSGSDVSPFSLSTGTPSSQLDVTGPSPSRHSLTPVHHLQHDVLDPLDDVLDHVHDVHAPVHDVHKSVHTTRRVDDDHSDNQPEGDSSPR